MCREKIAIASDICVFNSAAMLRQDYVSIFEEVGAVLDLSLIEEACRDTPEQETDGVMPWFVSQFGDN